MVRGLDPLDVIRVPVPEGLTVAVVTPEFELPTRRARSVLPGEVSLGAAVGMAANVAGFVSACHAGDLGLLSRSLRDEIVTPVRAALIPGAVEVIESAMNAGALGEQHQRGRAPPCSPCVARCEAPPRSAGVMVDAFGRAGLSSTSVVSPADCPGARRL